MQLTRGLLHSTIALAAAVSLSACTSAPLGVAAPKPSAQAVSNPSGQAAPGPAPTASATTASRRAASRPQPATGQTDAARASRGTATRNAKFVEKGASRTDTYPKFVPPHPATTQMTDAEKKAFEAQMAARIKANQAPRESPGEYQERLKLMRALAAQHGRETLQQIEQ